MRRSASTRASKSSKITKKSRGRILVFTDSRGEHKKSFSDREIFTEKFARLMRRGGYEVELLLCPFKWTTTLDLIELFERGILKPNRYDKVVLYTGVVEWSPRNASNYQDCLAIDAERTTKRVLFDPKRQRKIANEKRSFLREFFGKAAYDKHARSEFDVTYRGEPTKSLVSPEMAEARIVPYLKQTLGDRLIYINANNIVAGWNGNYLKVNPDGRPKNIGIINDFAAIMSRHFGDGIDLAQWSASQVKRFTVDNMHLTHAGSEWIFERLMQKFDRRATSKISRSSSRTRP